MAAGLENVDEDQRRAEVFDALSHPTRIMILKALSAEPLGFADLKKRLRIESSGQLQHHLNKLGGLVKTDSYGKYILSDQGKDALLSVETMEKVAESGGKPSQKLLNPRSALLLKAAVVALAVLLVLTSVLVAVEFNQASEFQSKINGLDNTIYYNNQVIEGLNNSLFYADLSRMIKPPEPHYLTTPTDSSGVANQTKLFLVSAAASYFFLPPLLGNSSYVQTIVQTNGSILFISPYGGIDTGLPGDRNPLIIAGIIRNDYTFADVGNGSNPNAPIGNSTSLLASFATLTVRLYDQNGSLIQPNQRFGYNYPVNQYVTLASGETTQINFILSPSDKYVDHCEIYVSSLSGNP